MTAVILGNKFVYDFYNYIFFILIFQLSIVIISSGFIRKI